MNWFQLNLRKMMWLGLALMLPLLSLNMQRKAFESNWYDQPFQLLVGGVQNLFFVFSDGVRGTTSEYVNLLNIKTQIQDLQKANDELKARLTLYDELQKENSRLASLLDFKAKSKMEMMAAQVVSHDLLADHSTIRINKGMHHGLSAGQAVLAVDGVVGYVFRPEAFSSLVLLVTDRYAVVDGIVSRSRARGIVEGKSPTSSALRYVERSEDVKVGDVVVTSGLDNIFPKGFPIAVVENVESKNSSVSMKVDLRPVVDPDKIEEVFVILNAANEDYSDRFMALNVPVGTVYGPIPDPRVFEKQFEKKFEKQPEKPSPESPAAPAPAAAPSAPAPERSQTE